MSLSAALVLATVAAAPAPDTGRLRGPALVEASVAVEILPAAIVRQASGLQPGSDLAPRPQLSRRGKTILFEFE